MIDHIVRQLSTASDTTLVVSVSVLISALTVGCEVTWIAFASPDRRPSVLVSLATGSAMATGAMAVGVFYSALLRWMWPALLERAPIILSSFWRANAVLACVVAFIAWDAIGWVYHWLGHRTAVGWAAHRPHHSGTHFDITLGLRQSWTPVLALGLHPLMALMGFNLQAVVVASALSNLWQLLEHTSVPVRFPRWFAAVVMTPDGHHHHHAVGGTANLGPVLTVWDRLAGTWVSEGGRANDGPLVDWSGTANPLRLQFDGWRALGRSRLRIREESPCGGDRQQVGAVGAVHG